MPRTFEDSLGAQRRIQERIPFWRSKSNRQKKRRDSFHCTMSMIAIQLYAITADDRYDDGQGYIQAGNSEFYFSFGHSGLTLIINDKLICKTTILPNIVRSGDQRIDTLDHTKTSSSLLVIEEPFENFNLSDIAGISAMADSVHLLFEKNTPSNTAISCHAIPVENDDGAWWEYFLEEIDKVYSATNQILEEFHRKTHEEREQQYRKAELRFT